MSPSSHRAKIDADMDCGNAVLSIAPGKVVTASWGAETGYYVQIEHDANGDGAPDSVVTYEHLKSIAVDTSLVVEDDDIRDPGKRTTLLQGDKIGVSGNTGYTIPNNYCHLHFQRSETVAFASAALPLWPIQGLERDLLNTEDSYKSANVGIGRASDGSGRSEIRLRYTAAGNYWSFGVPATMPLGWLPCRAGRTTSTPWRYTCQGGEVQIFTQDSGVQKVRAIMHLDGAAAAWALWRGILGTYTSLCTCNNKDYVYSIGYPTASRVLQTDGRYRQDFANGYILWSPSTCSGNVYRNEPNAHLGTHTHCDVGTT